VDDDPSLVVYRRRQCQSVEIAVASRDLEFIVMSLSDRSAVNWETLTMPIHRARRTGLWRWQPRLSSEARADDI
jgi:hypothetical protein